MDLRNIKKPRRLTSWFKFARQRPTLTGERPQLPSALESLTSVFGMGTGVASLPSPPDYYNCVQVKHLQN